MDVYDPKTLWRRWSDLLSRAFVDPSIVTGEACPTCGAFTLHFAYIGDQASSTGFGALWCTTSNDGVTTGRAEFPTGVPVISFDDPDTIPNFDLIQPTDSDSGDGDIDDAAPTAVAAVVTLCNQAAVDIRSLARSSRDTGGREPLDQIILIVNVCDGLATVIGDSAAQEDVTREDAAREALAYRWSTSGALARTWIAETLLGTDPGYQTLIDDWERGRDEWLSQEPAPWVRELGIDESNPADWRRTLDTGDGTR